MGITQEWAGQVWLSDLGIRLPALRGTRLLAPEGLRAEKLISNNVLPINYLAGLQWPVLSVPLTVTANWFYPDLLNFALGLNARPDIVLSSTTGWYGAPRTMYDGDVGVIGSVIVYNGAVGWQLLGCKVQTLVLGLSALGQVVQARLEIVGLAVGEVAFTPGTSPFALLSAKSQQTSHNLGSNPTAWRLTVRNPLSPVAVIPDQPPNGSLRFVVPTRFNAGQFESEIALTFHAEGAHPETFSDGTPFAFFIYPPGAGHVYTIHANNYHWLDRYGYTFSDGPGRRQYTTFRAMIKGVVNTLPPISIF